MQMKLRPYQERAITACREAFQAGSRRIVVVSPTGSGKTVVAAAFVKNAILAFAQLPSSSQVGNAQLARRGVASDARVLFLCHRDELIRQSVDKLHRSGVRDVGVISAKQANPCPAGTVQVASVQTLVARCMGRVSVPLPSARLLILDEAHHYRADQWGAIVQAYGDAVILGLTATPARSDGKPLGIVHGGIFDAMVVVAQPRELIADHFLVPCEVVAAPSKQESGVIMGDPVRAQRMLAAGRSTVLFASTIAEATKYRDEFRQVGVTSEIIHQNTNFLLRRQIFDRFEAGEVEVLTNVNVASEGWDSPKAEVCQIARGCGSQGLYIQMVGRVLRPRLDANGRALKGSALLIDHRGVSNIFGYPDEDRKYTLEKGIERMPNQPERTERTCSCGGKFPITIDVCPWCGKTFQAAQRATEMVVVDGDLAVKVQIKRDPQRIAHYWRLLRTAEETARDRRWAAIKFRDRFGHWPEGTWWDWYKSLRERDWDNVPAEAREAAEIAARQLGGVQRNLLPTGTGGQ